ncbi:5-methyltetrahydropteroyltriglutamate--homocysteine S-methyltransferase [Streptococcus dentiloxodontae]
MVKKYFEHVGSFLRPKELKEARAKFAAGDISQEELTAVEDKLIKELIDKEVAAGLEKVTDGEFRRAYWHLDNFWGFDGVEHEHYGQGYLFHGEETGDDTAVLRGKLGFSKDTHPFIKHYQFYKALADEKGVEAKITIPAPAQFLAELDRGKNAQTVAEFYPNRQDFLAAIAKVYREEILALYEAGARTVQLDDCTWGMLIDEDFWNTMAGAGFKKEDVINEYLYVNNNAIKDLPADLTINTHVCRGNFHSTFATKGPYDDVAEAFFGRENAQTYFLEFDDERSGGFEPLKEVPADKVAVLGLITTKKADLEDKEAVIARIREAQKVLPLDQLWISTQCGFASTEEGNILTEADQWKKLALVKAVIDEVWN